MKSGSGFRGEIGASACPSACCNKFTNAAPKRAASSCGARAATSPMVFSPARRSPRVIGIVRAECVHRQRCDGTRFLSIGNDAASRGARHGARADRCAGNRRVDNKALPRQRCANAAQHRSLAAEQMRATADIEQQSMRRIKRHQRRKAVTPVGDGFQQFRIGGLVGVEHFHIGTDCARVRQRQSNLEVDIGSGVVQRRDLKRVVQLGDDDARTRIIRARRLAPKAGASIGRSAGAAATG